MRSSCLGRRAKGIPAARLRNPAGTLRDAGVDGVGIAGAQGHVGAPHPNPRVGGGVGVCARVLSNSSSRRLGATTPTCDATIFLLIPLQSQPASPHHWGDVGASTALPLATALNIRLTGRFAGAQHVAPGRF